MSGIKPIALTEFYRSLHARGESTENLARQLNVSGAVVRKLIGLLKRRRGLAWEGLLRLLTERERELLAHVEQCSAWNIRQRAKRPAWTAQKASQLASTLSP
jgi:hypothetical protein